MVDLSIVIPVYNEEGSLDVLFTELKNALLPLSKGYEIIFVNDCSSDGSLGIMKGFKADAISMINIIDLSKRSGQTMALMKGLGASKGEVIVTLDADLQNDPADIPVLLEKLNQGFDCVCGWRKARHDSFLKSKLSKAGNVLQRMLTGLKIHDVSCTLRAYKKECAVKIPLNWEGEHRFIPLCLSLQGYKVGEIVSNHRQRKFGQSKYTHKRIFRVVFDFFKIIKSKGNY